MEEVKTEDWQVSIESDWSGAGSSWKWWWWGLGQKVELGTNCRGLEGQLKLPDASPGSHGMLLMWDLTSIYTHTHAHTHTHTHISIYGQK